MPSRRQYLTGAAVIGGLASVGFATSQEDMLTGEPTAATASATGLGEFGFNNAGVETVRWVPEGEDNAGLSVSYQDTSPSMLRLHDPDSKKIWQVDDPSDKSDTRVFGLPIRNRGTWELVTRHAGEFTSLQLPITPRFQLERFGLDGNRVVASILNPTNAPAWIKDVSMSAKNRFSERWRYLERLMPGEAFRFEETYPFDYYEDIRIYVDSDTGSGGLLGKRDFV